MFSPIQRDVRVASHRKVEFLKLAVDRVEYYLGTVNFCLV